MTTEANKVAIRKAYIESNVPLKQNSHPVINHPI